MPISEQCTAACQARIDLVPGMALADAKNFVDEWRKAHRHYEGPGVAIPQQSPFGFPIPQRIEAVSTDTAMGDEEPEFEDSGGI